MDPGAQPRFQSRGGGAAGGREGEMVWPGGRPLPPGVGPGEGAHPPPQKIVVNI